MAGENIIFHYPEGKLHPADEPQQTSASSISVESVDRQSKSLPDWYESSASGIEEAVSAILFLQHKNHKSCPFLFLTF